jgi:hypothetical protein
VTRNALEATFGTGPGTAVTREEARHSQDELTVRIFRALYRDFDLYTTGSTYVVVPKGTPYFSGGSLGSIARQISEHESRDDTAQTPHARTSEDGTPRP